MPERRKVLPAFLLSAMLAINGCGLVTQPTVKSATKTPTPNSSLTQSWNDYHEITGYPIKASGEFATQTGTVRWLNYSDFSFNPKLTAELYRFFQDWATQSPTLQILWQKQPLTASLTQRPNRNVDLYLIPQGTPIPGWWTMNPDAGTRAHVFSQDHEEAITIVRAYQPITSFSDDNISSVMRQDTELFSAVESCQALIRLEAPGVDYRMLQESFCNSASIASFMRKNGYSYELFTKLMSVIPMHDFQGRPVPTLTFAQDRYNAFSTERIINPNE